MKPWTEKEKMLFDLAYRIHSRDYKAISKQVGTRTYIQCKNRLATIQSKQKITRRPPPFNPIRLRWMRYHKPSRLWSVHWPVFELPFFAYAYNENLM